MATIAMCPKCQKAIAAPEPGDPQSWVRCPLCGGQFQLQAALEIVPPTLELVAEPKGPQPVGATPTSAGHVPDFPALVEVSPHLATHFAAIPHSPTVAPRISLKQKHVFLELAKIVLGGLAGLVLGYAILFWGFRVDPFHFARLLPAGVVPKNFNPDAE